MSKFVGLNVDWTKMEWLIELCRNWLAAGYSCCTAVEVLILKNGTKKIEKIESPPAEKMNEKIFSNRALKYLCQSMQERVPVLSTIGRKHGNRCNR